MILHLLLKLAMERMASKKGEHNLARVDFESYCPFGNLSASTMLHREALRVCVESGRNNQAGVDEHLIDTVVYAMLQWDMNHPRKAESCKPEVLDKRWDELREELNKQKRSRD